MLREGEGGRNERGERETPSISHLPHRPLPGTEPQPSMCPDLELNPHFFSLWDDSPTNQATLARASYNLFEGYLGTYKIWYISL